MSIVTFSQTVDIGGGRGRATREAVASIRRIDAQLGRPLDINSAWRDPVVQQKLRDAYLHYRLYGAPWAPIALAPKDSIHCRGTAIDSDDGYNPAVVRVLNDHGWFHTVYRTVNGKRTLVEPWHFEYFRDRDQHRNDPAPAGSASKPIPVNVPEEEDDDMYRPTVHARTDGKTDTEWTLGHPSIGTDLPVFTGEATDKNSRLSADKTVKTFRGFMVTVNRDIFTAWARTHAKGTSQITSRTDRDGYIAIQRELSRVAGEIGAS